MPLRDLMKLITAHQKVFESKEEEDRNSLKAEAERLGEILSHKEHHKVTCPACKSIATVQGDVFGKEHIEHKDGEIILRQTVIPTKFACIACGLKLSGYGQLSIAGVGGHFTHRVHFSPEEFYDLVSVDDHEAMTKYAEVHGFYHFSND